LIFALDPVLAVRESDDMSTRHEVLPGADWKGPSIDRDAVDLEAGDAIPRRLYGELLLVLGESGVDEKDRTVERPSDIENRV